jgi:glucuronate isomerase
VFYVDNRPAFASFVSKLEAMTKDARGGRAIDSYGQLLLALEQRAEFFKANGCRMSDHGPDKISFPAELKEMSRSQVLVKMTQLLERARNATGGAGLSDEEVRFFKAVIQQDLCRLNAKMGWTQQLHVEPFRRINTAALFASLRGEPGEGAQDQLARTVVYTLNPASWRQVYTTCLRFPKAGSDAHCMLGFPWWFNHQEAGLREYLSIVQNQGNISTVPEMVCDGRSLAAGVRFAWAREII